MLLYDDEMMLNGDWQLEYCSHETYISWNDIPLCSRELRQKGLPVLTAQVPGNVELDLCKAGLLEDPLTGDHIKQTYSLEGNHYWYTKFFLWNKDTSRIFLQLDGVDTFSEIYLNGVQIGTTDNMLISHTLKVSDLLQDENELMIHIYPTVLKAREEEYPLLSSALDYGYDGLRVRKAPYMYGWDIMPRMISAGIWKSVYLVRRKAMDFTQCYLYTRRIYDNKADLGFFYELDFANHLYGNLKVRLTMLGNGQAHTEIKDVWSKAGRIQFTLENPQLWWPRGYGEPCLYTIKAELLEGKDVLCSYDFYAGIRTIELDYRSRNENDPGQFRFIVNGRPIYVLGTNWVPLHVFPSQHHTRLYEALKLVEDIGCNMVRCWGGNVYESKEFYDICDRKGILVWQDFSMACGLYPMDAAFMQKLENEICQVIRERRQHPCICLWAGDNECDCAYLNLFDSHCDPNQNQVTRQLLPMLVMKEDFARCYLPSSPYVDNILFGSEDGVERHLWGDRLFFETPYYIDSTGRFISEIGYHGCPSPISVKKFIDKKHLWPAIGDEQWLLHASSPVADEEAQFGYRIRLMDTQIFNMFGYHPDNLDEFALCSQISQAEAMKLFIETFRTRMGDINGVIWWNILDGCPQFSDAVVDFYFRKKLAYFYIKTAQQPVLLAVRRDEDGWGLYGVNDTDHRIKVDYTLEDEYSHQALGGGNVLLPVRSAIKISAVEPGEANTFCTIRWTLPDGSSCLNHKYIGRYPMNARDYVEVAQRLGILKLEGFDCKYLIMTLSCFKATVSLTEDGTTKI